MAKAKKENTNPVTRTTEFFGDSMEELKKIHPPTREETIKGTIGVIMMVIFFGLFLGLSDYFVGRLASALLS